MTHATQMLPILRDYFGGSEIPIVTQEFRPGRRGWTRSAWRKRISASYARTLRRQGVTFVELDANGRRADFAIEELVRR